MSLVCYFLNSCEQINHKFLTWLSDFKEQSQIEISYNSYVEAFYEFCNDLFETEEYKMYANKPPMQSLSQLYALTREHWYKMAEQEQVTKQLFFNDLKWIEIRDLAKQTKELLEKFITVERKRSSTRRAI